MTELYDCLCHCWQITTADMQNETQNIHVHAIHINLVSHYSRCLEGNKMDRKVKNCTSKLTNKQCHKIVGTVQSPNDLARNIKIVFST